MSSLSPKKSKDDNDDTVLQDTVMSNGSSPSSLFPNESCDDNDDSSSKSKNDNDDNSLQEIMIFNGQSPSSLVPNKSEENSDENFFQEMMITNGQSPTPKKSKDNNGEHFSQEIMIFKRHNSSSFSPSDSKNNSEDNDDFLREIMTFSESSNSSSLSFESETYRPKILCVGLCRTDIIQVCKQFPEECSDLECMDFRWERGGNASNTCTVLSQFETNVEFLGTLSDQQPTLTNLVKDMVDHNIYHRHCPIKPNTTCPTASIIINSSNLTRTRWSYNPNLPELSVAEFSKINLEEYSWIHFEGRNLENVMEMIQIIHKHNVFIRSKDFRYRLRHHDVVISIELEKEIPGIYELFPFVDLIFIGENFMGPEEAENMTNTVEYVSRVQTKPGVIIVYARDERGAVSRAPNGELTQCPDQKSVEFKPIVDIYGTSDTFNAAMIYFLNQEVIHKYGWETYEYDPSNCGKASPLDFICPNILYQALVFACRVVSAKMEFKGFAPLRDIYESLTVHQEIKL